MCKKAPFLHCYMPAATNPCLHTHIHTHVANLLIHFLLGSSTHTHVANLLIHLVVGKQHTHTCCRSPDSLVVGKQHTHMLQISWFTCCWEAAHTHTLQISWFTCCWEAAAGPVNTPPSSSHLQGLLSLPQVCVSCLGPWQTYKEGSGEKQQELTRVQSLLVLVGFGPPTLSPSFHLSSIPDCLSPSLQAPESARPTTTALQRPHDQLPWLDRARSLPTSASGSAPLAGPGLMGPHSHLQAHACSPSSSAQLHPLPAPPRASHTFKLFQF